MEGRVKESRDADLDFVRSADGDDIDDGSMKRLSSGGSGGLTLNARAAVLQMRERCDKFLRQHFRR
jgi:hypothetical protein